MKYAVVESGGKQYVAREGESVEVDRLPVQPGSSIKFDRVLLVVDGDQVRVGEPIVEGLQVQGTVSEHIQGPKIVVFRYIPKERYRRKTGHRQQYSRVTITAIGAPGAKRAEPRIESQPDVAPAKERPGKAKPAEEPQPAEARPRASQGRARESGRKPREGQGKPRESQGKPGARAAKKTTTKTTTAKKPSKK